MTEPQRKKRQLAATSAPPGDPQPAGKQIGTPCTDVNSLPPDMQQLIEQMLTEGATFEDVVQTVNERHAEGVTLTAVQNFFRSNLALQKQRILHQVDSVETLKAALDKDPDSAEGRLAAAALFHGYLGLHRKSALITPKDAARDRLQRRNLDLQNQLLVMKKEKSSLDLKFSRERIRLLRAQVSKAGKQLYQLECQLREHRGPQALGPEAFQKIQEIYGIFSQTRPLLREEPHPTPEEGDHAPAQA